MFSEKNYRGVNYLIHYPLTYDSRKKYPVIFYFHGSGSRGTYPSSLKYIDFLAFTKRYAQFEFITVVPQCHEDSWFDLWERVKGLVAEIADMDFCDSKRVYAIGVSMGGYAAWQIAMSMPWCFAAILPICGGGMYWNARRLKNIPVWAFHGEADEIVRAEESIKMVDAINAAGGNAKLTVMPNVGHDVWPRVFSDPEVFKWLLSQKKP